MKVKPFRIATGLVIAAVLSVVLAACGSGDTAVVASQETAAATATAPAVTDVVTTASEEPTGPADSEVAQVAVPESAGTPADTPTETTADTVDGSNETSGVVLQPVDDPVVVTAVQIESAPGPEAQEVVLSTSFSDFGFALKLDLGADVQTAGWTEPEPSLAQGIIAFSYGGVNTNLVWGPPQERTPLTFLVDTYNILRASQPSVTFESISDGEISIGGQAGVYGGFKAVDDSGSSIGGGLIGAWICGDGETAFRMTLTGADATVVQLRFDRLLENFACASS